MASIQKTAKGYRAQIAIKGMRESASFRTQREAAAWAIKREAELRGDASVSPAERKTLADLLKRYREEVTPTKRGAAWEDKRIAALLGDADFPSKTLIGKVTPELLGAWRDARGRKVRPGSVLRDFSVLSAALEHARLEWRWISSNPIRDVRKPPAPDHRRVVISPRQARAMLRVLGYSPGRRPSETRHAVALCFLTAMRTGMRAGELCGLTWDRVYSDHCVLPVTKTKPRDVPLSGKANRLIERMRGWDERLVFGLTTQTLDALFRKYRQRAGLDGFTFHDTRHTAATMLAKRLHVLDLCKMFGWVKPDMAMIYYNPTAGQIAQRIDRRSGDPRQR